MRIFKYSGYLGYEAPSHPRSSPYPRHLRYRAPSNPRLLKSEASQIWGFSDLRPKDYPIPKASQIQGTLKSEASQIWGFSNLRLLRSEASQIWGFSNLRLLKPEASQTWSFSNLRLLRSEASQIWGFSDLRLLRSEASQVKAIPVSSKAEAPPMWGIPVITGYEAQSDHSEASQIWGFSNLRLLRSEASQIWGFSDLRLLRAGNRTSVADRGPW